MFCFFTSFHFTQHYYHFFISLYFYNELFLLICIYFN
nr:MAG TPA: hypothetical protein [Siphoviridae sp. ctZCl11]